MEANRRLVAGCWRTRLRRPVGGLHPAGHYARWNVSHSILKTTTRSLKTPSAPKNNVAKTLGIEHSCNPVRAAYIGGQSGAFTPKMSGALMPEIDKYHFFTSKSTFLGIKTALEALAEGAFDKVLIAATGFAER